MKADTFRIDGNEKGWAGLHNPAHRWNGWACPMFTYETMQDIARWIDGCVGDDPDAVRLIVRDGSVMETDGEDTWELSTSVVDGVTYYSTDGWVWDADDFPTEEGERVAELARGIADAMRELSDLWGDRDVADFLESVGGFPFSESFDAVASGWNGWAHEVREALKGAK